MIQFRPYNQKKDRLVKEIFQSLGIEKQAFYSEDAKYFLIDTGEEIIGICAYEMIESHIAHVRTIFIKETERRFKFGDGLFRATLNSIDLNGGISVIFTGNEKELAFYLHEEMEEITHGSSRLNVAVWDKILCNSESKMAYLESVGDFFKKPCKGHKA